MDFFSWASPRVFKMLAMLFLSFLTFGCEGFVSDQPLVDRSKALTPFSGTQDLVMEAPQSQDELRVILHPRTNSYEAEIPSQNVRGLRLQFFDLSLRKGEGHVYGVQVWEPGKSVNYGYAFLPKELPKDQSFRGAFFFPSPTAEMLQEAGITFRQGGDEFNFSRYEDLYAALRHTALEGAMGDGLTFVAARRGALPEPGGTFPEADYRHPKLLAAIHRGKKGDRDLNVYGLYLQIFTEMFTNTEDVPGCRDVISISAHAKLATMGIADGFKKALGPLFGAHKRGSDGRDEAFRDGVRSGLEGTVSAGRAEANGRHDARVFFRRHGCTSATAQRFFSNFEQMLLAP